MRSALQFAVICIIALAKKERIQGAKNYREIVHTAMVTKNHHEKLRRMDEVSTIFVNLLG